MIEGREGFYVELRAFDIRKHNMSIFHLERFRLHDNSDNTTTTQRQLLDQGSNADMLKRPLSRSLKMLLALIAVLQTATDSVPRRQALVAVEVLEKLIRCREASPPPNYPK